MKPRRLYASDAAFFRGVVLAIAGEILLAAIGVAGLLLTW